MANKSDLKRPGFGLDIDHRNAVDTKIPIAVLVDDEAHESPLLTLREYKMMAIMNTISDKESWQQKIHNADITTRWRSELVTIHDAGTTNDSSVIGNDDYDGEHIALENPGSPDSNGNLESDADPRPRPSTDPGVTNKMFDWCIEELKYKADICQKLGGLVEPLDGIWRSDTSVSTYLQQALQEAIKPLEDVPENRRDWHPGSNGQVLDLVHPSLYPLVYGQSKILQDRIIPLNQTLASVGQGGTIDAPWEDAIVGPEYSRRFQWLPSEFVVKDDAVSVASYINNLHPEGHKGLYRVIPKIIAKAIPLWNRVLSNVKLPEVLEQRCPLLDTGFSGEPEKGEAESYDDYEVRYEEWRSIRQIIQPEPGPYKSPPERRQHAKGLQVEDFADLCPHINLAEHFDGKLQIIVKLANIHLTPENPEYDGGSWHVEGQANESICATALYYYDSENVTDSKLSFRQQTSNSDCLSYEQNDHDAIEAIYGLRDGDPCIRRLGSVLTRPGRLLAFPNTFQHRVSSFLLKDKSRPGHRKILALFLVDPHIRIISTANVPPQQQAWWSAEMEKAHVLGNMPPEIRTQIWADTDYPISLEKAKEQRLELMEERKRFVLQQDQDFVEYAEFSLCEH